MTATDKCRGCQQIVEDVLEDARHGLRQSMAFRCHVCGREWTAAQLNESVEGCEVAPEPLPPPPGVVD